MHKAIACSLSTLAVLLLSLAAPSEAGWRHRRPARPCPARSFAQTPAPPAYSPAPASTGSTDPAGFVAWLNATRASYGLGAVGYDPGLALMAAVNSAAGFNHHPGTNPGRQNVGVGDLASVSAAWMASPPHAAALLDPGIRSVGIATVGGVTTFNGR